MSNERIAYGGHWWKLDEEGLILVFDEDNEEWDLWEGALTDPLPPPEFVEGTQPRDIGEMRNRSAWPSFGLLKVLVIAFITLGIASVATQAILSYQLTQNQPFGGNTGFGELIQVLNNALYPAWQVALGGVIAVAAISVHRYVHERKLIETAETRSKTTESAG